MKDTNELLNELNNKFDKLLELLSGGVSLGASKPVDIACQYTLFEWLKKWYESEHKNSVSSGTFYKDGLVFKNHVFSQKSYDIRLLELKPIHIQQLVNSIVFPRQRVVCFMLLNTALKSAFNNGYMLSDITLTLKKPHCESKEDRALKLDEENKLLMFLYGSEYYALVCVLLFAGLRRNEALGLMRKHIDFVNNTITVEQQVTMRGEITSILKTKKSRRVVKMFPELKEVLLKFEGLPFDERLFNYKPDYITRAFANICRKCGIDNFTLKSCRTTFASRCVEKGIPNAIIQLWLGHTTVTTTSKYYIKINEDFVENEYKKAVEMVKKT